MHMRLLIPVGLAVTTLAVTTLAVTTLAGAPTIRAEGGDELERSLAILRGLDATRTSVNYVDLPLGEVLEDLNRFLDVPLSADWDSLLALGIDARTELTLRLEEAPLGTVLAAVAFRLGTGFDRPRVEVFRAGMLVLTSDEGTERMRLTDVYDVRDLVADGRALGELRRTAPSGATEPGATEPGATEPGATDRAAPDAGAPDPRAPSPSDGEPGVRGVNGAGGATTRPGWRIPPREDETDAPASAPPALTPALTPGLTPAMTPAMELMILVCEHVDPEAWIGFGGTRAVISERDGVLLVSAAPTVHRSFRDVLRRLRRACSTQVAIEAAIVDVPLALYRRLERRHETTSAAFGEALLAADEATVLWRAATGAAVDETIRVESKGDDATIALAIRPTLDRATAMLRLEIDAASRRGDDERSVRTAVTIAHRNGAATLELPAATAGETVRLLVLLPRR